MHADDIQLTPAGPLAVVRETSGSPMPSGPAPGVPLVASGATTGGALRWGAAAAREAFWLLAILLCFPLGVLAVGLPIAAAVRLTLWLIGLL
jgi:hypothetical protein